MLRRKCEYVWKFLAENDCASADNITNGMLCAICGRVLINAHSARCGCRFCLVCLTRYLDGGRKICPGVKDDCREELMDISETVVIDHSMNQDIMGLIVICPRKGCDHRSELRKIEEHERMCDKRPVDCPYFTVGCQEPRLINDNINEHLTKQSELHIRLLMECIGMLQNEMTTMKKDIATLTDDNRELQNVIGSIKRDNATLTNQIQEHHNEIGSIKRDNETLTNQIQEQHNEIETMMGDIATLTDDNRELQKTVEQQAKRLLRFDQEMRAVKNENLSMRREITSLQSEIIEQVRDNWLHQAGKLGELERQAAIEKEELREKIDEVAIRVRDNWINVENRQRAEYVWVIDQWAARIQAARSDTGGDLRKIYSNSFYLVEDGYRMCLAVGRGKFLGDSSLYIWWQVVRGPFDAHLSWPFKGDVVLSVIDQQTRLDHAIDTVKYDECPQNNAWKKPKTEKNDFGFYANEIKDLIELSRNPSLVKDDRLLIRCVVTMIK